MNSFETRLVVLLREGTLSSAVGLSGGPGQPATIEAFVARAILYAVRANERFASANDVVVVSASAVSDVIEMLSETLAHADDSPPPAWEAVAEACISRLVRGDTDR